MCKLKFDELLSLIFGKKIEETTGEVEESITTETELPTQPENPLEIIEIEMKNVVICLDNGHGDNTPGKCSPWSACKVPPELPFREYAYTRELVRMLTPLLEEDGFEVYQVVPEEYDVTLAERCSRINKKVKQAATEGKHALMISIHNNAAGNGREWKKAYGWSVWTTRGQNISDKLAQCLYDAAIEVLTPLGQKTRKDRSDGDDDYEADFYITKRSNCPAVLVENMFQDCIDEVKWMLTDEGKQALVEIHRKGINKFVEMMNW